MLNKLELRKMNIQFCSKGNKIRKGLLGFKPKLTDFETTELKISPELERITWKSKFSTSPKMEGTTSNMPDKDIEEFDKMFNRDYANRNSANRNYYFGKELVDKQLSDFQINSMVNSWANNALKSVTPTPKRKFKTNAEWDQIARNQATFGEGNEQISLTGMDDVKAYQDWLMGFKGINLKYSADGKWGDETSKYNIGDTSIAEFKKQTNGAYFGDLGYYHDGQFTTGQIKNTDGTYTGTNDFKGTRVRLVKKVPDPTTVTYYYKNPNYVLDVSNWDRMVQDATARKARRFRGIIKMDDGRFIRGTWNLDGSPVGSLEDITSSFNTPTHTLNLTSDQRNEPFSTSVHLNRKDDNGVWKYRTTEAVYNPAIGKYIRNPYKTRGASGSW